MHPIITALLSGEVAADETIRGILSLHDVPRAIKLAACVHYLATTPVVTDAGEVKAKWEVVRVVKDKPLATTWVEFCREHLGICFSTASRYKRVWEVFAVGLGCTPEEIAEANITDLREVVGSVAKLIPEEQRAVFDRLCSEGKDRKGKPNAGFVYLFSASELGFKIGRTRDLGERLQKLVRAFNARIEVVGSGWFDDCVEAEAILHARFRDKRRSGEWFDLGELDIDYIWGFLRKR